MDANIIRDSLIELFDGNVKFNFIRVDFASYFDANSVSNNPPDIKELGETAIFMERVFYSPYLDDYKTRILIPNPEWLDSGSASTANRIIDFILHKSRNSFNALPPAFPGIEHRFVGFTSPDPCKSVRGYEGFSHFRGLSPRRHTDEILSIWQDNENLPQINIQLYGDSIGFRYNGWLKDKNVRIYPAFFESKDRYFDELAENGMHLCTSEVEGFGHYINESRAMSAAIIALDAPPMNEFVSQVDAILVPVSTAEPMEFGVRYRAERAAIEDAIERMLSLSESQRADLGRAARHRFEQEGRAFHDALRDFVHEVLI